MAKVKSVWFCTSCGNESPKWLGRCPACGEWNTMKEELSSKGSGSGRSSGRSLIISSEKSAPVSIHKIEGGETSRTPLDSSEFDRLLGGGLVPGSMILLGGEPGIGKSTLSLQLPLRHKSIKTLYVSGEESPSQIKMRADRLGGDNPEFYVYSDTLLENIIDEARKTEPKLLIIDSIQTLYSDMLESSPGSVSQVRECAAMLLRYAKESGTPVILIGHITKDGTIAGPKVLEHIVDVVLQFEGDSSYAYRVLRSIKNRFGSTSEIAIFEMTGSGLLEILNPSEILTPMHNENLSGVAVGAMMDGSRSFLIEVQALVSSAAYGMPQRSATGFDVRRMNMLLAVLEKRAGFKLANKDVFLNMAGGLKINDPACDLAVVSAILSSNFDITISPKTCFSAEVGLSGEIRPVSRIEHRIAEAQRLGYKEIYISSYSFGSKSNPFPKGKGIKIIEISDIASLCRGLFG